MYRLAYLIVLYLLFCTSCQNQRKQSAINQTIDKKWKKIPDDWIERAQRYNYAEKSDTSLVSEFSRLISPDTLLKQNLGERNVPAVFKLINTDLDGDGESEIICLQGWSAEEPCLCVFKHFENSWYLIYGEHINTFYEATTLYLANIYAKNKTFYLRRVNGHGSGIYLDGVTFYKLIDNRVYKCLEIVNNASIYGWGLFLNQVVKSKFEFDGDHEDNLSVEYTYNFFPGCIETGDCSWCVHEDLPLINGVDNVFYTFNAQKHQYILDSRYGRNNATELNEQKIRCFGDFGNDSLFVKAYKRHIDTVLKIGTPLQKKILRKYLALVKKNKTVTTEEVEPKAKTSTMTFYGPKK